MFLIVVVVPETSRCCCLGKSGFFWTNFECGKWREERERNRNTEVKGSAENLFFRQTRAVGERVTLHSKRLGLE